MKRRLTVIASIICIIGGLAFAQQPSAAPPKIAVLIVTGQNGHNWRGTTPLLRKILEDTGKFEVRVTEEFRGAGPETLAPYDLVVLNYFERGRPELRWGEKTDSAFLDFVRSGKGVVVYHFSMAAFDGWTEYEKLSGGNWRPNNGHHSAPHNFVVEIKDQEHPIRHAEFRPLIHRLLERFSALRMEYGNGQEQSFDERKHYVDLAQQVQCIEDTTYWEKLSSYSQRTRQHTAIGGIMGRATFAGDLAPFRELLVWGELIHVGKNAVKGNGWYRIEG